MKQIGVLVFAIFALNSSSFPQTVTDIDGNQYEIVQIGTQLWMAENLKTTQLNNGGAIALISDNIEWSESIQAAMCWFDNDTTNKDINGALYNWYAINTDDLCPSGWHIPTDEEWKTLEKFIGLTAIQADSSYWRGGVANKLKSTSSWLSEGFGTNESGFKAIASSNRYNDGEMGSLGDNSIWWSSTLLENNLVYNRELVDADNSIGRVESELTSGLSVRCIKD